MKLLPFGIIAIVLALVLSLAVNRFYMPVDGLTVVSSGVNSRMDSARESSSPRFASTGFQEGKGQHPVPVSEFGVTLHSDGDRLFPPGPLDDGPNYGLPPAEAVAIIIREVDTIADAGFETLKMGLGTDVLNWPSEVGSSRDWRIDDSDWALPDEVWAKYKDLRGRAWTARRMFEADVDPVRVAAERARERGMRFIISYRIADTHFTVDPANYPLTDEFYLQREFGSFLEDAIAIKHDGKSPVPGYQRFDTLMNFSNPSVRSHRRAIIFEALDRYKDTIDGFEIEFNRSVALFPFGDGASNIHIVTSFLREVREKIGALSKDANPLYFGIRVPWDDEVGRLQGLDVAEQIRERNVHYIVPSNIMTVPHDMDIRPWIALAKPNDITDEGVAVFAGLSARKPRGWTFPEDFKTLSSYRLGVVAEDAQILGAARGYFSMGVDGVELYNFAGLVANATGARRLESLAGSLRRDADTSRVNKIFAVTPVHARPYEGRLEYVKRLPAEFRADGTVWTNSWDGGMFEQEDARHYSRLYVTDRLQGETEGDWYFRLGLRGSPEFDSEKLSLEIIVNGTSLWNGPIDQSGPADLIAVGDPKNPAPWPSPTHYFSIPIPSRFPLKDNEFNDVIIRRNPMYGNPFAFNLQEIQVGVFY